MKRIFTTILSSIIAVILYSQPDTLLKKQFILTGKIVEKVQMTSGCGIIAWGTVVEFEVIDLVGMSYPNKRIGIIITCPELYGSKFFKKGQKYQVVFSDKNQAGFSWSIPNRYILKKNSLSFEPYAISIKKMP